MGLMMIQVQCQDRSALVDFLLWRRGPGQMVLRKKLLILTEPVVMTGMMTLMKNMIPSRIDLKGLLQAKSCLGVPPRKGQDFLAMSTLKLIFDQANSLCEHYSQNL